MSIQSHKRMQFVSDGLVQQVVEGRKTASTEWVDRINSTENEFDDPLVVGEYYDVYDSNLQVRATIRVIAMELCHWEDIPERLWRGETNSNADEFRQDHLDFFNNPKDGFEFIAYYFKLVK